MYLRHLSLTHFRNYARLEVDLPARVNVLQGDNAQGKTNLLEAVFYLATTRSPLAASDRCSSTRMPGRRSSPTSMPRRPLCAAVASVAGSDPRQGPRAPMARGTTLPPDTRGRRAAAGHDAVGAVVVLFLLDDIALVAGAPDAPALPRHHPLPDRPCCRTLSRYNRVLAQRNALLRQVRERRRRGAVRG